MPKRKAANNAGSVDWVEPKQLWRSRFTTTDADGLPIRKAVYAKTQKEAVAKAKALEEQYRKGLVTKKDGRTFEEFAIEWLNRKKLSGKTTSSIDKYQTQIKYINVLMGKLKLQKIKPANIRQVLDWAIERGLQRSTQAKILERMRAIFAEALRLELIYRNPAEAMKIDTPPSEPRGKALETDQISVLLNACDVYPNEVMGLFIRLLLGCGLRKGEALGLQWQDLDFGKAELAVIRQYTGIGNNAAIGPLKTRKSKRIVPIPLRLLERFQTHYQDLLDEFTPAQLKTAYIFGDMASGKPWQVNSPNHALSRMVGRIEEARKEREKKTGVTEEPFPSIRIHDLRHTFGSVALAKGFPVGVVSEVMGHANITTTQNIYRHILKEERQGFSFDIEAIVQPSTIQRAQA